ncbi:unnamed protein product [Closterium sp. Yama58-4]|nr:unnamed protein product [Closterium sp. Yama58-4]
MTGGDVAPLGPQAVTKIHQMFDLTGAGLCANDRRRRCSLGAASRDLHHMLDQCALLSVCSLCALCVLSDPPSPSHPLVFQGLDYALMTGGDVAPLGPQAVTKIHQMFDWAAHTKRGLLLFIDEADAFLCERNKITMSEAQRSALNAMLFRTGDQSRDIVLVLATNRPEDLDSAVTDRIDEMMEFPLPREEERFRLLQLYLHRYVTNSQDGRKWWKRGGGGIAAAFRKQEKIEVKGISEDVLRDAARKMEGFSGREIAKFMASVRGAVYGSKESVLDAQLFLEVVDYKVAEHQQRRDLVAGKGWEAPGEEGGVAGEKKAE